MLSRVALLMSVANKALAETMKFADSEQGAAFDKCVKVEDFMTKTLDDEVEVVAREEGGCCPDGYTPGAKWYTQYQGAQIVCGFKEDGKVAVSTGSSNGAKTCTYNNCYVHKQALPCKEDTKQLLNGCCGAEAKKRTFQDGCEMYEKNFNTVYKNKVDYCLSYDKDYGSKGNVGKNEPAAYQAEGKLVVENLWTYHPCAGSAAGGGDASGGDASGGDGSASGGDGDAGGSATSCNTGTAYSYSGCGEVASANTFAETKCAKASKCISFKFSAEANGCSTTTLTGLCVTGGWDCTHYDKTYKNVDTVSDYDCKTCDSDNCNPTEADGGGGATTTSDNTQGAVVSTAILAAMSMFVSTTYLERDVARA